MAGVVGAGAYGFGYAEIQAGLARTQMEHLKLPAATSWHWMEAYGRMSVDPVAAHSDDWRTARGAGAEALRPVLDELPVREREWLAVVDAAPVERLAVGSGWGALELARTGWSVSAGYAVRRGHDDVAGAGVVALAGRAIGCG